jgi:hypothetical protein
VGLTPAEFWNMTFKEIELACKGYETRMARIKEVPRVIAAILMNVNREKGRPAIRLEDVFPLYTDTKGRGPRELMTKEEYLEMLELRKKIKWQTTDLKRS